MKSQMENQYIVGKYLKFLISIDFLLQIIFCRIFIIFRCYYNIRFSYRVKKVVRNIPKNILVLERKTL